MKGTRSRRGSRQPARDIVVVPVERMKVWVKVVPGAVEERGLTLDLSLEVESARPRQRPEREAPSWMTRRVLAPLSPASHQSTLPPSPYSRMACLSYRFTVYQSMNSVVFSI